MKKIYQSITDDGAIKHEDITKQRFLHFCIADKKLILSKSFVDILSYIFADIAFTNDNDLKQKCEQTKSLLPEIILSQLLTAGNLISNIHGAEYITNVFDKNKKVSKKPNIFMANCSLSKIYAKEETKRKFESVLLNLNPTIKGQDSSRRISICVFPKVNFKGDEDETDISSAVWESDDEQSDESSSQEIGDETGFSDFTEYLEYCSQNDLKIMNFISLDKELVDLRDTAFDNNNENSLTHFVKKLRSKVSAESLKHVSICIPDSIFLPSFEYNIFGKISKTAVISIKGAFMVASIVMRNDHYEIIKVLLKNNVKNKGYTTYIQRQPGIGVGPDKTWRKRFYRKDLPSCLNLRISAHTVWITKSWTNCLIRTLFKITLTVFCIIPKGNK